MVNLNQFLATHAWILVPVLIWSLVWKGIALWKAARRTQLVWFVALLILNTLGILEIVYIFTVARKKPLSVADSNLIPDENRKKVI